MAFFGSKGLSNLRSLLRDHDLNVFIRNKIYEIDSIDNEIAAAKREGSSAKLIAKLRRELELLESIEYHVKIKIVRILESYKAEYPKKKEELREVSKKKDAAHNEYKTERRKVKREEMHMMKLIDEAYNAKKRQLDELERHITQVRESIRSLEKKLKEGCIKSRRDTEIIYYNAKV